MSSEKQGTPPSLPFLLQQPELTAVPHPEPSAPEVQQQGSFRDLVNEGEQEEEEGEDIGEGEKVPGSGPGGVPHKYFRVSKWHPHVQ